MKLAVQYSILAATLLFSVFAQGSNSSQLNCQSLRCMSQQVTRHALSPAEIAELPAEVRISLEQKAIELAQIWGDTILEGDYYASEQTEMDSVEVLTLNQKRVGYRITYSSLAWFTADCTFDSQNLSTLNSCEEGRIVESGFVSQDFKEAFQDRQAPVEFISGSR